MICKHCKQDLKDKPYFRVNGEIVCMDCLDNLYYFCNNCYTDHLKTEPVEIIDNLTFCPACAKKIKEKTKYRQALTDLKELFLETHPDEDEIDFIIWFNNLTTQEQDLYLFN